MKYQNAVVGQRVEVKKLMGEDESFNIKVGAKGTITYAGNDRCRITYDGTTIEVMLCEQLRKAPALVEVPKIKVGDRVICMKLDSCDAEYGIFNKAVGTVLEVHEKYFGDGTTAIVKWDKLEPPKYDEDRHMYCAGKNNQLALLKPIDASTVNGVKIYAHTDAVCCSGRTKYQGVVGVLEDNGLVDDGKLVGIRFKCGGYICCLSKYVSEIVEIPNEV